MPWGVNTVAKKVAPKKYSAKPAGGSYVGGIPFQGAATTTRTENFPAYKQQFNQYNNPDLTAKERTALAEGAISYVNQGGAQSSQGLLPIQQGINPGSGSKSGGGGGGRRRGRGGGGGGAANHSQAQMDWMSQLLGSDAYKVNPATYDALRANVSNATAQDKAAADAAYNALDTYLQGHQSNPYANVQLSHAAGGGEDAGYGAFQNVLALLGANAQESNASRGAESQMARAYSGNQIGAVDNAYLFNIQQQQAQAQQALDAEKRQGLMQMMQLIGTGAAAPNLASLGYGGAPAAAAAPSQQDFFNWFNTQAPDQQTAFRSTYGGG